MHLEERLPLPSSEQTALTKSASVNGLTQQLGETTQTTHTCNNEEKHKTTYSLNKSITHMFTAMHI